MDVFDLPGRGTVSYMTLYRHMLQRNKAKAYRAVCATPAVANLFERIKAVVLRDPTKPGPRRVPNDR